MVFDSRITQLKHHFGIMQPEDWQHVEPGWILRQPNIGPATLEHIRIYLAMRDLTLKNDQTPEYWKQHLSHVKIGQTMGLDDEEIVPDSDRGIICPFTILIDTAEQQPFTFQGLRSDSDHGNRPLIVPIETKALGRHPDSLGDYSISGCEGRIGVERKSLEDAQGTILGWDGRRDRFERELRNLEQCEAAVVVVESSFEELIQKAPARKRTVHQNAKALFRSVLAFQQDYRVPWLFAGNRRLAEQSTFRFLERFWRKGFEHQKRQEKALAEI